MIFGRIINLVITNKLILNKCLFARQPFSTCDVHKRFMQGGSPCINSEIAQKITQYKFSWLYYRYG